MNPALQSACGPGFGSTKAELGWDKQNPPAQVPAVNRGRASTPAQTDSFPTPCGVPLPSKLYLPSPPGLGARTAISDLSVLWASSPCTHRFVASTQGSRLCLFGISSWPLLYLLTFHPPTAPPLKQTSPMDSFHWPWERGPISSGASNITLTMGIFTKGRGVGYLTFVKQAELTG